MLPVHQLVPRLVTDLIAAQPHSAGKVEAAWRLSVGAALARMSSARRDDNGAVLVEAADPHVARELEANRRVIEPRLYAMLGDHGRTFRLLPTRRRPG
jgi:hypothetical protein